jgi:hypothetical protein
MAGVTIVSKRFQPYRILILKEEASFVPALPYEADFDINTPNDQRIRGSKGLALNIARRYCRINADYVNLGGGRRARGRIRCLRAKAMGYLE